MHFHVRDRTRQYINESRKAKTTYLTQWQLVSFLAASKQLYDWFSPSVCLSVRPSVTPFSPCSHHRIIMKFSGVITMDRSDVKVRGQRSRSEVKGQCHRGQHPTWNHAHSWKQHRRGAPLFFKVIRQISRSHGSKNRRIWPRLGVSWLWLQFEFTNGYEMIYKALSSMEGVPYCFSRSSVKLQGHTALKIVEFDPIGRFRTVTPIWIHQWVRNDAQSLK